MLVRSATLCPLSAFFILGVGISPTHSQQATETVIANFSNATGMNPSSPLLEGPQETLFGVASNGGLNQCEPQPGCGVVFELAPPNSPRKAWTYSVLYEFTDRSGDGAIPTGGLIADKNGNLYGATAGGGAFGGGTVFRLLRPTAGHSSWTESVLYSFGTQDGDGTGPAGSLVGNPDGVLYGTTSSGGIASHCGIGSCGTVFAIAGPKSGIPPWDERVLHSFGSTTGDGTEPLSGVIRDPLGRLYGTTYQGGAQGAGTVFQLTPPQTSKGIWSEAILTSLPMQEGGYPVAGLSADSSGALYGITNGEIYGAGIAFKLVSTDGGFSWTFSTLASFSDYGGVSHGSSRFLIDSNDILYNSASGGSNGAVFSLTQSGVQEIIYSFGSVPGDSDSPSGNLIADQSGRLYGTTGGGGTYGQGTAFILNGTGFAPNVR